MHSIGVIAVIISECKTNMHFNMTSHGYYEKCNEGISKSLHGHTSAKSINAIDQYIPTFIPLYY